VPYPHFFFSNSHLLIDFFNALFCARKMPPIAAKAAIVTKAETSTLFNDMTGLESGEKWFLVSLGTRELPVDSGVTLK
jgi:hypothetical protein